MRISFLPLVAATIALSCGALASAQTGTQNMFTKNLSFGSQGMQVIALQQALNRDPDTRVASAGPGSPGSETGYFGSLTKVAVVRFQEKYASDILAPVGLPQGNGYVGAYTRAKLNALSALAENTISPVVTITATSTATAASSFAEYLVKESEKVDIYVGDKLLANVQNRIYAAMDAAIASTVASRSALVGNAIPSVTVSGTTTPIALPKITSNDVPNIAIGTPSPRLGTPDMYISIKGTGITSESVVYFGSSYIVRKVSKGSGDNFIFVVPPIPPGRYDIAMKAGGAISNTTTFIIRDPKNPSVHLESISPATVAYGGTLTIIGSGFAPENNVVITTYQKFTDVPSMDGKTLTVRLAPKNLQEYAKISSGAASLQISVSVENDYGFSDSVKTLTMTL